ncbi:MAG: SPFH domain-containing protein, partial [Bacilli bacterium]
MEILITISIILLVLILVSIKQVNAYEKGILFSYGKFNRILDPGWHIVLPIIRSIRKVDIRTKAVDVPDQNAITKDNISVKI